MNGLALSPDRGYDGAMIRLSLVLSLAVAAPAYAAKPAAAKPNPKLAEFMKEVEKGQAGDVFKQTVVAFAYQSGEVVPKDEAKAMKILLMAGERGFAMAQAALGSEFRDKNPAESARWLERAAEQGHTNAEVMLALHFHPDKKRSADDLPADPEKTYFWSTLAMLDESDVEVSKVRKDMIKLLPADRIAALDARLLAWEPKRGPAWQGQLGIAYLPCFPCVRLMAEAGDPEAQWMLGNLYLKGIVLPKDEAQALSWYRRSAEQGFVNGQRSLAAAYYYGYGTAPDGAEMYFWIGLAAKAAKKAGWYDKDPELQEFVEDAFEMIDEKRAEELDRKIAAWKPVLEKKAAKPKTL